MQPKKSSIFKYIFLNWKQGYHLLVRTNRFGVNNKLWGTYKSILGIPVWKQILSIILIYPIVKNYKAMKIRAIDLGLLHPRTTKLLWGKHEKTHL